MSNIQPHNPNNKNNSGFIKNDSDLTNTVNRHDIKTVHNDIFVPQHDNLNQRSIVGSKNKYVHEIEKQPDIEKRPGHNFGHEIPQQQMSNETKLKNPMHITNADDSSGWLNDEKIRRPMPDANPTHDITLDKQRGRERVHTSQNENSVAQLYEPPVYREPISPSNDGLHHHFNEHIPPKEQQDAKWWRREVQPTQKSAPFEDIRSVPTQRNNNEYDCSGRCSNNVYDVHNHEQQPRGAYHWQQGDKELEGNKVTRKYPSI